MSFDLENIKDSLDNINLENLLPDLSNLESTVLTFTRWALLLGPLVLLGLGIYYFLAAPKEANHTSGYRCWFGMGSVQAWRFTQRLAGMVWAALGLILVVVALIAVGSLGGRELMDALLLAGKHIFAQVILVLLSVLGINGVVFARYDAKGMRRATWKELLGREK